MPGQPSFRRVLISRVLLISIPILLVGVAATFRKARTSLLQTAYYNLVESAATKAEGIETDLQTIRILLETTGQSQALQFGDVVRSQQALETLQSRLNPSVQCIQLNDAQTGALLTSTCADTPLAIASLQELNWPMQASQGVTAFRTELRPFLPSNGGDSSATLDDFSSEIEAVVQVPVYGVAGQLQYTLTAQSILQPPQDGAPRSFLGYTVLIDKRGRFLAHPLPEKIGQSITAESDDRDVAGFKSIVIGTQRQQRGFHHLFNFSGDQDEWIAGYTPLILETGPTTTATYTVVALTRLDDALQGLDEITQTLFWVMAGLLGANLLALLYLAKELAEPIEQLGQYALRVHQKDALERVDNSFKIRELNNLAQALDLMLRRLAERATELETAWQEAEAANQLKSEFLANTSHELRTPLNAIIGCVRLIRDGCCDSEEEEMEFLDRAFEAATHLLKIINDLLDIAKIEAGKLSLSFERVNIQTMLQEVIDLQSLDIQQKGLTLNAPNIPMPLMVYADPGKLKQVLLNVIFNAIKFTDQGSITIKARVEPLELPPAETGQGNPLPVEGKGRQQVVISVEDTGIGIDPSQQSKLFRPFVMVDGSTTRKFEGTGLGLAISRNFMGLMGGNIELSSAGLDQGTTVEITMPLSNTVPPLPPDSTLMQDRKTGRSPAIGSSS